MKKHGRDLRRDEFAVPAGLPVDKPIVCEAEDRLGWTPIAQQYRDYILSCERTDGLVVGLFGPWGGGKTSFFNLMFPDVAANSGKAGKNSDPIPAKGSVKVAGKDGGVTAPGQRDTNPIIVKFNPWLYSGTEDLVLKFFSELASQIPEKMAPKKLRRKFIKYGRLVSPFLTAVPRVGTSLLTVTDRYLEHAGSAQNLRLKLQESLSTMSRPIIVLVDDIDRLPASEVKDIVKLVRLTGSFPNMVYILACDRRRTENVLKEDVKSSSEGYLDKIVQLELPVPEVSIHKRQDLLREALESFFGDHVPDDRYYSAFEDVIFPATETIRGIRRLKLAAALTVQSIGDSVDLTDLLTFEAIRVLRPKLFEQIRNLRHDVSVGLPFSSRINQSKPKLEELIEEAGSNDKLLKEFFTIVFPHVIEPSDRLPTVELQRHRRLAHWDYLSLYFDRVAPKGIALTLKVGRMAQLLSDPEQFLTLLRELPSTDQVDALDHLHYFIQEQSIDQAVTGISMLLNLLPDLSLKRSGDGYEPSPVNLDGHNLGRVARTLQLQYQVSRNPWSALRGTVRKLVECCPEDSRKDAVVSILDKTRTFSSKLWLLNDVGLPPALMAEEELHKLKVSTSTEFVDQSDNLDYSQEWSLAYCYLLASDVLPDILPIKVDSLRIDQIRGILSSCEDHMRESLGFIEDDALGNPLRWDQLFRLFGPYDHVKTAVDRLRQEDGESDLVGLAEKHLIYLERRQEADKGRVY